jgi:phosphoheptose isomerase
VDATPRCRKGGNKLLVCGNTADCEHIVGELMKDHLKPRRISPYD